MKLGLSIHTLIGILSLLSASAQAADYSVDSTHSHAGFTIRHLVGKVSGEFKDMEGSFSFDEKHPEAFKGSFKIKAASINTNNDKRDTHLRSPDFFDVAQYPNLTFEAKSMKSAGNQDYKMTGDFTLHGVTKPVTFDVEYNGTVKDPWGNMRAGFVAKTKLNRKDFGIVWNKTLDSGGLILGDEVNVEVDVEAPQKK